MSKKSSKKTTTRKGSKDCDGVLELKNIAAKIADVSLPVGTPQGIKDRLQKMSARLVTQADGIQAAVTRSNGSIERTAAKKKRLIARLQKTQEELAKLDA